MRKLINKICECGKTFNYGSKYNITRHENSKVHKEFLITNKTREQLKEEEKQNRLKEKLKEKEEAKVRAKEKKSQYYKERYRRIKEDKQKIHQFRKELIDLVKKIKSTLL